MEPDQSLLLYFMMIMFDRICKKVLYACAVTVYIIIEKFSFKISKLILCIECLVYTFLHLHVVIHGNSIGLPFNSLLAKLPAIIRS